MFGERINAAELRKLSQRVEQLRELRKAWGISEVELMTALISMDDRRKVIKKARQDRGEE